jgi:hypothetical protein
MRKEEICLQTLQLHLGNAKEHMSTLINSVKRYHKDIRNRFTCRRQFLKPWRFAIG